MPNDVSRPRTLLRTSYERSRALPLDAQVQELVDHLEHPQVIVGEILDAARSIEASGAADADDPATAPETETEEEPALLLEHFTPRRLITVQSEEPFVFRCMTGRLDPLAPAAPVDEEPNHHLDYLGLLQERERIGILGAVQSSPDETVYATLLRALCAFSELLAEGPMRRIDRDVYKGALGEQPIFDLHVVCHAVAPGGEAPGLIDQLTRDLADVIRASLVGDTEFAAELGGVLCLRMDAETFDGELALDWRV